MIKMSLLSQFYDQRYPSKNDLLLIEDILKSHHGTILIHFRWLWSNLGILSFGNLLLEKFRARGACACSYQISPCRVDILSWTPCVLARLFDRLEYVNQPNGFWASFDLSSLVLLTFIVYTFIAYFWFLKASPLFKRGTFCLGRLWRK